MKQQLDDVTAEFNQEKIKLQSQIVELTKQRDEKTIKIAELEAFSREHLEVCNVDKKECMAHLDKLLFARSRLADLESQLEKTSQSKTRLEAELQDAKSQVDKLRHENNVLQG